MITEELIYQHTPLLIITRNKAELRHWNFKLCFFERNLDTIISFLLNTISLVNEYQLTLLYSPVKPYRAPCPPLRL